MGSKQNKLIRLSITYFILFIASICILYPLLWTIGASFNPGNSLMSTSMFPKDPTFSHFTELFFGQGHFMQNGIGTQ